MKSNDLIPPPDLGGPVFLIARQPILDRKQELFGYELLYRSSLATNYANFYDGDQATLSVMLNTFSQAGLNTIVGDSMAFINLTRSFLVGRYPIPLPAERAILEILEDIQIDDELVSAVSGLCAAGYQFALDDVVSAERVSRMSDIVSYAKVDIAAVPRRELPHLVRPLREQGLYLLAEKVETMEEYRLCRQMGFDLFQGYYFCRPEIIKGRRLDTSRLVILHALSTLQKLNVTFSETERVLSMDATLGYRVLKLVNSAYYSLQVPVTSLRHAISMIGLNELNKWLMLLLMTRVDDKPHELCMTAMFRAKMTELIARQLGSSKTDSFFLAGLFSILDGLLDMPMAETLAGIELAGDITAALLRREGDIGQILLAIEAIEQGNWAPILSYRISPETINSAYMQTLQWTEKIKNELNAETEHDAS